MDSSLNSDYSLGRYSFLGINPFDILETKGKEPFPQLREALSHYRIARPGYNLPFLGGAVGYLSYDLGLLLEKKIRLLAKEDDTGIPDSFFAFYNSGIIIDHWKNLLYIFSIGLPEKSMHLQRTLCQANIKHLVKLLSRIDAYQDSDNAGKPQARELKSNFLKSDYLAAIKRAKEHIKDGDIYQVNLSQRFQAKTNLPGFTIYERLRQISPSYFGSYLDCGKFQILSSSPERFLKLESNFVSTRPMKGTRPRARDAAQDRRLKKELLKSAKDKAELTMIVDLERNDLGKVCNYESIKVGRLRELEEYATVFQTTATVEGRLHKSKDRIDLLRACFPGGSITGCPKIRAMEIIEELEPTRRSVYTGCLGYLSFSGSMDFNILIRTILKKNNMLYFGVGGGIVADSEPEAEYAETLVKARAMLQAIGTPCHPKLRVSPII